MSKKFLRPNFCHWVKKTSHTLDTLCEIIFLNFILNPYNYEDNNLWKQCI